MSRKLTVAFRRSSRRALARISSLTARFLPGTSPGEPASLFVLGNQKSGTTAIAALLAKLTGRSVTLDFDWDRVQEPFQRLQRGEVDFAAFLRCNRLELGRTVVKEPTLTLFAPELRKAFPAARFCFVLRDPRDNIRSILDRLDLPGDRRDLERNRMQSLPLGWRQVLEGTWLQSSSGDYIEALARRWNAFAEVYLADAESMLLVRYEEFKADKLGTLQSLADDLGWPATCNIRGDLDRPFQPRGNAAVSWPDFFGTNQERIEKICGSNMCRLGYRLTSEAIH